MASYTSEEELGEALRRVDPLLEQHAHVLFSNGYRSEKFLADAHVEDLQSLNIPLPHARTIIARITPGHVDTRDQYDVADELANASVEDLVDAGITNRLHASNIKTKCSGHVDTRDQYDVRAQNQERAPTLTEMLEQSLKEYKKNFNGVGAKKFF
eukprot:CAMPEP_0119115808 /NCGR_PEP_ID=MMETSP1180-20130426/51940_1 /TAXON_ID=3052 ORGANISM="Chlamydomonas cf sp, Strain CCMP681" /NCGR_SAMPLE_ID=MMETSP1180 /ASSEMBLY_ACC=CAM_ASM_000741 /LENGTH=154 /DNA_ID=CAMNT_0007104901 /DNA_START=180 /DNA_END=645 /DNA_ORIENTATION=-